MASQNPSGRLTPQNINATITHLEQMINRAYDSYQATGKNMNTYFKELNK